MRSAYRFELCLALAACQEATSVTAELAPELVQETWSVPGPQHVVLQPTAASLAPQLSLRADDAPSPASTFSVRDTRDLHVTVSWANVEGEHRELRVLYAPSGELYHRKLIPFSTDIDQPSPFELTVDIPHAAEIQPALPDHEQRSSVTDDIAIAGTWISDRAITGAWQIEVYLDGAKVPALTESFELTP